MFLAGSEYDKTRGRLSPFVAMGHKTESLDEFVEAHMLNDLMYFPSRNAYGMSSIVANAEWISAVQNQFENVKKRMDEDTINALQKLVQKIKVLTQGYQV